MIKKNLVKLLVWVGDYAAKNTVCSASVCGWHQPKEPKHAAEKYLSEKK